MVWKKTTNYVHNLNISLLGCEKNKIELKNSLYICHRRLIVQNKNSEK